jgi:hypothetical protein
VTAAGERVIIKNFNPDGSRSGYSVIEGNRESHFSKDWDRTGYSIHDKGRTDHFDRDWDRQGHSIEKDDRHRKTDHPFE